MPHLQFALLVFAACAPVQDDAELPDDVSGAADDDARTPSTVVSGTTTQLYLRGARPGATVTLYRSSLGPGAGPCPANLDGACLGLLGPARSLTSARANGQGRVAFQLPIPVGLDDVDVWLQAAHGGMRPKVSDVDVMGIETPGPSEVMGTVIGYGIGPAHGALIEMLDANDQVIAATAADMAGDYDLLVPAGTWRRRVSAVGYATVEAELGYDGDNTLVDQDVVLQPTAAWLFVRALDSGFNLIPNAIITTNLTAAEVRVDGVTGETVFEAVPINIGASVQATDPASGQTNHVDFPTGFHTGGYSIAIVLTP